MAGGDRRERTPTKVGGGGGGGSGYSSGRNGGNLRHEVDFDGAVATLLEFEHEGVSWGSCEVPVSTLLGWWLSYNKYSPLLYTVLL